MILSDTIIKQIKSFGALQYTIDEIIDMLVLPADEARLLADEFAKPDSLVSRTYRQGEQVGIYNIDAALMKKCEQGDKDAIEQRETLLKERRIRQIKKDYFGV